MRCLFVRFALFLRAPLGVVFVGGCALAFRLGFGSSVCAAVGPIERRSAFWAGWGPLLVFLGMVSFVTGWPGRGGLSRLAFSLLVVL
ncbi:hypothetical protein [Pacificibacter marinus]|uniref:hypothetical protein n=1 Tax=Pacificibacter marinus TaxID=658057 RepID=UPI00111456F3|nr:hypothetical protein [Pacificibacter marinus]